MRRVVGLVGCASAGPSPAAARRRLSRYGLCRPVFNALALVLSLLLSAVPALAVPAGGEPVRITVLGDSLSAGFGIEAAEAVPARLEALLQKQGLPVQVANAGVSGDTTAGGLARLDWALADHPDILLVELGANDALRGIDPKVTEENLARIIEKGKAAGARVLLAGMYAPANWGREYQQRFDAIYGALARRYEVPLYPFFLDGVALDPKLNQPDGLHPTAAGAEIIAERLAPMVAKLVAELRG